MEAKIQIINLCKTYSNGTEALKDVNLEIQNGQFFALLGPNGAGKSTLVKIITTIVRKDSGELYIRGLNPEKKIFQILKIIGVASQENEVDPAETVENLMVFQCRLFCMPKKEAIERADWLIEAFQLNSSRDKKAGALSGENKRRLHCALALVHNPKILFLDEPTAGMDPVARSEFWKIISGLNKDGVTIFLTTQYLEEAEKYASTMSLIVGGRIHYSGTISNFKKMVNRANSNSLEESYLQYLEIISKKQPLSNSKK